MHLFCFINNSEVFLANPYKFDITCDLTEYPYFSKESLKEYFDIDNLDDEIFRALSGSTDKLIYIKHPTLNFLYQNISILLDQKLPIENVQEYDQYLAYDYVDGFYHFEI